MGKDLTRVCLPVYFNEPLSALQKSAEDMEYSELLDKVLHLSGPILGRKCNNNHLQIASVSTRRFNILKEAWRGCYM